MLGFCMDLFQMELIHEAVVVCFRGGQVEMQELDGSEMMF